MTRRDRNETTVSHPASPGDRTQGLWDLNPTLLTTEPRPLSKGGQAQRVDQEGLKNNCSSPCPARGSNPGSFGFEFRLTLTTKPRLLSKGGQAQRVDQEGQKKPISYPAPPGDRTQGLLDLNSVSLTTEPRPLSKGGQAQRVDQEGLKNNFLILSRQWIEPRVVWI